MNRTVECPRCDRLFKDEHGLKQHLADVHREGKRPRAPERYPLRFDDADDYADLPDANVPPPDWEFRVYGAFCIALLLAVLVVAWRVV